MPSQLIGMQMSGGAVEFVVPVDLLCMRKVLAGESNGTISLRKGAARYVSTENIAALTANFTQAGQRPVARTAANGSIENVVNARHVRETDADARAKLDLG